MPTTASVVWEDRRDDRSVGPVIGLVIGHVPCALDHQRRIRDAGAERVSRAAARARRADRRVELPEVLSEPAPAEDVWLALRF